MEFLELAFSFMSPTSKHKCKVEKDWRKNKQKMSVF